MSDSEDEKKEKYVKIVFLGDTNVGKTAIIKRYCYGDFIKTYVTTSGVDFFLKRILLPESNYVTLKIFDVGGNALGSNMLGQYVYNADVIILTYDITNLNSFEALTQWLNEVKKFLHSDNTIFGIFGNKSDCEHQRAIRLDKTYRFCKENNLSQFTVSARTGEAIAVSIITLVSNCLGIKLTEAQQEQQTMMINAEIEPRYTIDPKHFAKRIEAGKKSSMCSLQ